MNGKDVVLKALIDVEVVASGRVKVEGVDGATSSVSALMTLAGIAAHTGERYRVTFSRLEDTPVPAASLDSLVGLPSMTVSVRLAQTRAAMRGALVFDVSTGTYQLPPNYPPPSADDEMERLSEYNSRDE